MPFAIWGTRIIAGLTGYAISDVKNFFNSGSESVSSAVNNTILLTTGVAVALLAYIFFFKK